MPHNIFKASFEAVLVCLDKCSDDYSRLSNKNCFIRFIDAKHFVSNQNPNVFTEYINKNNCLFDVCIEEPGTQPFCIEVDNAKVSQYNYTLFPELYIPMQIEKKPGEVSLCVKELLSHAESNNYEEIKGNFILDDCFKNDSKIMFEAVEFEEYEIEDDRFPKYEGEFLVITHMRDKFLMCKTSSKDSFCLERNQVALKLNEDSLLSLDYVIYSILRSGFLDKLSLSMSCRCFDNDYSKSKIVDNIMDNQILVHFDKVMQDNVIFKLKDDYEKVKAAEEAAEKQRSAHREISSDLSHMLGTTFDKIGDSLSELEDIEEAKDIMTQMKDSFEYMQRLIDSVGKDFSKTKSKAKVSETCVNKFFLTYCEGWKNYGKNTFTVNYESSVGDETTFNINNDFMKVLLDTLLDNVYRHGFERFKSPDHLVKISTSFTTMDKKKYILLSVANNGKPFPEDFSLERYISRGEFYGQSGRTGLGGNHVYSIAKYHDGYICLTNDENWRVIVEILIPVEYFNESEINKFEIYGNAKECM